MRLRFLERVRNAQHGATAIESNNSEALTLSLERHLSLILNTHQGSSASAKDFGMPDFVSLNSLSDLDGIKELNAALTEVIRKYESRLLSAQIVYVPGNAETGILEFTLSCTVEMNNEKQDIFFSTSIAPDGKISVHR
jgi:type VI secretion system protein